MTTGGKEEDEGVPGEDDDAETEEAGKGREGAAILGVGGD
jgi:hypothetical protein